MRNRFVLVVSLIFILSFTASAQISKIGIVFDADTTLVYQYIGLTIFSNTTKSLPLNIDIKEEIIQKLDSYLKTKHTVEVIQLPDSLVRSKIGFFDSGIGKKLRDWLKTKDKEYDIIVFIRNQEIPSTLNVLVPPHTNGLYKRKSNIYLYTTITFYAYRTSTAEELEYYNLGGGLMHKLKKFKLPKNETSFPSEITDFLEEEYKEYLDQRVRHFLARSYILPGIDKIK